MPVPDLRHVRLHRRLASRRRVGLRASLIRSAGVAGSLPLVLGGCGEWITAPLSSLDPAGPGAAPIATLWWVMFWASLAITAFMVMLGLLVALRNAPESRTVPARLLLVGGGLVFPLVVVTALLVYGLPAGQALLAVPDEAGAIRIDVNAHRWWWQVRYRDSGGGEPLHDANEIHVPTGRPVHIHITTSDVIHAFWVPRLGGKLDAIPGITNVLRLSADRAGIYRGQCAEFCGDQHARMGFTVEAHDEEAWKTRLALLRRRSAVLAAASGGGADAFRAHCASCHSIDAQAEAFPPAGLIGPNLAGIADRRHLGAGWTPNRDDALERWIAAQHRIKPGNTMPAMTDLAPETVQSIVDFLEQRP